MKTALFLLIITLVLPITAFCDQPSCALSALQVRTIANQYICHSDSCPGVYIPYIFPLGAPKIDIQVSSGYCGLDFYVDCNSGQVLPPDNGWENGWYCYTGG